MRLALLCVLLYATCANAQRNKYTCVSGNCRNGIGRISVSDKGFIEIEGKFEDKHLVTWEPVKIFDDKGNLTFNGKISINWNPENGKLYKRGKDGVSRIYQEGVFDDKTGKLKEGKLYNEEGIVTLNGKFDQETGELLDGKRLTTFRGKPAYLSVYYGYAPQQDYMKGIYKGSVTIELEDGTEIYQGIMKDSKLITTNRITDTANNLIYYIGRDWRTSFPDKNGYPTGRITTRKYGYFVATNVVYDTVGIGSFDYVPRVIEAVTFGGGSDHRLIGNFTGNLSRQQIEALGKNAPKFEGKLTGFVDESNWAINLGPSTQGSIDNVENYWNKDVGELNAKWNRQMRSINAGNYPMYEEEMKRDREEVLSKLEGFLNDYGTTLPAKVLNDLKEDIKRAKDLFRLPARSYFLN